MFVFKHAFLNLRRHIWNYLLVGIMLFLLILGTMVTNTIYTSAKLFTKNYSKKFMTVVTILEPDLSNSMHEEKLTKEQYIKFGESKYVTGIEMIGNVPISFETLKPVGIPSSDQFQKNESTKTNYGQTITYWIGAEPETFVNMLADSGMEINGGSTDLKQNECFVSSAFAQLNQLKIGDSIEVALTGNQDTEKQTLVVAGMYQPKEQVQSSDEGSLFMSYQGNDIFTNWETLNSIKNFDYSGHNSVSYELKSMDDFDKFLSEMKAKGLPSDYQVITNEAKMNFILSPVNGVRTLAGTILLGFLIFGNFWLALFSVRKFRKSQTELYVLRNLGITKQQIIKSRVTELVIVTCVSFSLASVIAKGFVQPIADWQLVNQKRLMGNIDQLSSLMASEQNESILSIPMLMNAHSFITILGMTSLFLITIISIDIYKLFKFKPIDFLLERNLDE
ncbi:ABC transporter permease [Enterococcus ureasiticus]|uniref:ABC transporter permease n=1 Tax=Enterococcus ureasiticus TaxID=903984 RepID=A0A1E5GG05_9ENTE|nr:ABC transporter permease [Enterococcus ureasiticus]OEG11666.1 ABC transporter permease [Enterococcus ureasiticus]